MRVPWTARRSNQSILKEISPGISLEGMMLKLKLQYLGHLMRRVDSLEKTLMLGGIGGRRRRGRQRMRWLAGFRGTGQRVFIGKREYVTQETNPARRQAGPVCSLCHSLLTSSPPSLLTTSSIPPTLPTSLRLCIRQVPTLRTVCIETWM